MDAQVQGVGERIARARYKPSPDVEASLSYHVVLRARHGRSLLAGRQQTVGSCVRYVANAMSVELEKLHINDGHIVIVATVPCRYSSHEFVTRVKRYSQKVMMEKYPEIKSLTYSLWDGPYMVTTLGQQPASDQIMQFIDGDR